MGLKWDSRSTSDLSYCDIGEARTTHFCVICISFSYCPLSESSLIHIILLTKHKYIALSLCKLYCISTHFLPSFRYSVFIHEQNNHCLSLFLLQTNMVKGILYLPAFYFSPALPFVNPHVGFD